MTHDVAQGWHDDLLVGGIGPSTITLLRVGSDYCAHGNAAPIVSTATGWPLTRYAGGDDVLTAVRNAGGWVSPADLARRLGRPTGTVNRLMWCMARDGELVSDGSGKYAIRRLAA